MRQCAAGTDNPMSDLDPERRNAGVALALLSLIWGYNWVAMKTGLADAGPLQFATLRFTLAALCMIPVIMRFRAPLLPRREQWPAVAILGFMLAGNFACTLAALRLGGTGRTAVLVYTMPFWVLVFAWLALRERLDRWQGIAVAIALAGLVVLVEPWTLSGGMLASVLALGAGMSWGASVVYVKNLQKKTSVSMLMITLWQMIVGSLLLALGWAWLEPQPVRWTVGFGLALGYTAVLATGVAWMLFYYALRRMPAGMVGLGTLATPVIGVLAAWLQLGERPAPLEATGMALIGTALAMLAWLPRANAPPVGA